MSQHSASPIVTGAGGLLHFTRPGPDVSPQQAEWAALQATATEMPAQIRAAIQGMQGAATEDELRERLQQFLAGAHFLEAMLNAHLGAVQRVRDVEGDNNLYIPQEGGGWSA